MSLFVVHVVVNTSSPIILVRQSDRSSVCSEGVKIDSFLEANWFKSRRGCIARIIRFLRRNLVSVGYDDANVFPDTIKHICAFSVEPISHYDLQGRCP